MEIYIENTLSLKPIPPEERICTLCKHVFSSFLKTNVQQYITCYDCTKRIRINGQRFRDNIKKLNCL